MARKKANQIIFDRFKDWVRNICPSDDRKSVSPVAKKLGVSPQMVRNWRDGKYLPNTSQLVELKKHYKLNIDWLLTDHSMEDTIATPSGKVAECQPSYHESVPSELREVCPDLLYIFSSKNPGVKQALSSNIREFRESIKKDEAAAERDNRITNLEKTVEQLVKDKAKLKKSTRVEPSGTSGGATGKNGAT